MKLQKRTVNKNSTAKNKKLSIQFSLDGFSFCITDIDLKTDIYFTEYTFKNTLTSPENLLKEIDAIFKTEPILQKEFKSIQVIHQNQLATLVPNSYFDETKLKSYLNYNIKTLETDFIAFDTLKNIDAKNVYIPYVNINNYLFQNFGEFEYQHHATVLIDKILQKETAEKTFYINVSKNQLDVVALQNNQLQLYNSFNFTTKEDFIYYILFTAEQLHFNPEDFQLIFLGDIDEKSAFYKITQQYIQNIAFLNTKENIFTNSAEFHNHFNYIVTS